MPRLVEPGETWGQGGVTLIGDSAHPTTPALGQGGCMALEASHDAIGRVSVQLCVYMWGICHGRPVPVCMQRGSCCHCRTAWCWGRP